GTAIGESIRELLQFAPQSVGMTPETELLLFEASRSQLVREVIKPALERGECVIADRFFDSTTVYQGAARKLDRKVVRQLNAFAVGDCVPDITFWLDVDLETARSRMQQPRRPDRMEQQTVEFYEQVRDGYQELAKWQRDRIVVIKGWQSPHEIEKILELEHGLQMRASDGRRKVAIIAEADRLQPQAANAFLKTLEEPPRNSLLLLLSALPEALPDTIVSRCISIPLAANGEQI